MSKNTSSRTKTRGCTADQRETAQMNMLTWPVLPCRRTYAPQSHVSGYSSRSCMSASRPIRFCALCWYSLRHAATHCGRLWRQDRHHSGQQQFMNSKHCAALTAVLFM